MELLELRLRRALCSPGSEGFRPDDRANKFKMSVSEMTPVNLPDKCAPGKAAAGTEDEGEKMGVGSGRGDGGAEDWFAPGDKTVADKEGEEPTMFVLLPLPPPLLPPRFGEVVLVMAPAFPPALTVLVGAPTGPKSGVAGALGLGEALSTTHILCDFVATSFATVCARVEYGLT